MNYRGQSGRQGPAVTEIKKDMMLSWSVVVVVEMDRGGELSSQFLVFNKIEQE